jgi:ABC-type oligopeptide transport system ATPase subunit
LEEAQKQEAEMAKKHDEKNYTQRIQSIFVDAPVALKENNREKIRRMYIELRGLYPFVPEELKKETYKRSLELYSALQSSKRGSS